MAARTLTSVIIALLILIGMNVDVATRTADATTLELSTAGGKAHDGRTQVLRVEGATGHEMDDIAWALDRYADAGIELPAVRFVYHDSAEPCRNSRGFYARDTRTVSICARGQAEVHRRVLLLHELGHAVVFERLDEQARAAFVSRWDRPTWNSPDHPWNDRGAELAADIVAWGLSMDLLRTSARNICETYAEEFARLTGVETPHANDCLTLRVAEVCAC